MKKISKIVIVVDSINIEDSSGSKANVALINNLKAAGYEVLVYHYTLKNIAIDGVKCIAIPEIKWSPLYFLSRFQRVLQRNTNLNPAPFLEKLFGFSFTFFNDTNSIKRSLKKAGSDFDLVLTLSKGSSFRPHFAVLQLRGFHDKWIAYVHDPYPFHFYPRPYNWVEPSYKRKETFFSEVAKKAKYSAFPSRLLQEWMGSYFPEFLKNGVIIPHQNAAYEIKNPVFPDYFDVSKFSLLHAGNLMKQRSPEGLIKGFQLFLQKNPEAKNDARLLLLGPADYHTKMLEEFGKCIPEIYIHNGNVAFDTIYNLQKNATVNIILESKAEISPFLPAKFAHCVEANKAILLLAPFYSETKRLLGEDYVYFSAVDEVEKIAAIIGKMYISWKNNPHELLLNRPDLEEYLSVSHLKETIDAL